MNNQTQEQPTSKALFIYLGVWLVFMCIICAPAEQSTLSVLWTLFAGGVLLLEIGVVGVWILGKIL